MYENNQKPTIAICYDFDQTLSPKSMQEYGYINKLGMSMDDFWVERAKLSQEYKSEAILTYLYLTMKSYKEKGLKLTRESLKALGKNIELFDGVTTWFKRINDFGKSINVNIEHYIISSGLMPMIEGTEIAKEFKSIFACDFMYEKDGEPFWPAHSINYTTKTQYLYRINKGLLDTTTDEKVNESMDKDLRPIPFSNIIYVGDSFTDIPCMRLTVKNGGHAIGVYNPSHGLPEKLLTLVRDDRINFYAPADYTENSMLDGIMKDIILKIKHSSNLNAHTVNQKYEAKNKLQ
ncbi:MAG: HAD family hydrolase [Spirochaetales bacterium]